VDKESYFIKKIANNKYIGDDGAVVGDLVYSMDGFFENVHFRREWMSLKQIAKKSMLVNISDAIAMNAKPKFALITIAIPKEYRKKDLKELASGFQKVAKEYGITIIGGDTISNVKLDISITIISQTKNPIMRSGTNKGDLVAYTGKLGTSKRDLDRLFRGEKVRGKSRFIAPKLRGNFFFEASQYVNSAMDISDGLFFELGRLSKENKVGFQFFDKISKKVGCSGEEYELLFTFHPKYQKQIKSLAKKHKIKLNIIAKATKGEYKCGCKSHHF
jgi:thiamine-monophosphate kinase